jgi:integrase
MARTVNRLSALAVSRETRPGMYPDGAGLYLQVRPVQRAGAEDQGRVTRSWIFRFTLGGRTRDMGLGSARDVSLAEARTKALEARKLKAAGIDPVAVKASEAAKIRADAARQVTFKEAAEAYVKAHQSGWRNAKHAAQWLNTLKAYAFPKIGSLPVQAIDSGHVVKVLEPIWDKKTETATRVRGRIERILDWAAARGYRQGENPARWRGHLQSLLAAPSKLQKVEHHPALPYAEIGAFYEKLRAETGLAADALRLLILTATRTSEVIGARWPEFDLDAVTWTIPAERIKAGREHRIPLTAPAVKLLRSLARLRGDDAKTDFVFPGRGKKHLSNGAILALLDRMGRGDITAHGFRSTFRDWAAECTNFAREVAEMALAHVIPDKTEAAYRRGDLFEKRRRLMDAWAGYVSTPQRGTNAAVPIRRKSAAA